MKKIVITLLCALLCLGLTGCGGNVRTGTAVPMEGIDLAGISSLDLTRVSGTVAYAQIDRLLREPENYDGMELRVRGVYMPFMNEDGTQFVSAGCIVADAAGCCMQILEFDWAGEHAFPDDYPPAGAEVTVAGRFEARREGQAVSGRLTDAELTWNG